jgi:hypothetical protein
MQKAEPGQILHGIALVFMSALAALVWFFIFNLIVIVHFMSLLGWFQPLFPEQPYPTPTHVPGEIWGVPASELTVSSERAYRTWVGALMSNDAAVALELYQPEDGADPAVDVEGYIAELRALRPTSGPEGPLGRLDEVREVGEYADPADAEVRYAVTQIIFERGAACFRGELVEEDGWHVRGWGRLSDGECEGALARIARSQR